MDVGEWSGSGLSSFISDIPCMEILMSLDVTAGILKIITAVLIINY